MLRSREIYTELLLQIDEVSMMIEELQRSEPGSFIHALTTRDAKAALIDMRRTVRIMHTMENEVWSYGSRTECKPSSVEKANGDACFDAARP